ncbi:putative Endonuclease/exonuclease/phosphatase superfamily [Helianthus annuus]|nr:putative Endonuclease/exonuclease/phosphatase superfamily [Helianthus annuus]
MDDYLVGPSTIPVGMREFYDCVQHNQLSDVKSHGLRFTWNQKPKNGVEVLKKIDRVMSNTQFLDLFPDAYVLFHPYRVSDHSPCILHLSPFKHTRPKPFKFTNFLVNKEGFIPCVAREWAKVIPGVTMFSIVKKLLALKSPLRRLLFIQGNLHNRVKEARLKLDDIQKAIDVNPTDIDLRETESRCIQEFNSLSYDEECFLKQKAKAEWLAAGDSNTKFFHNCVKMRNASNKIHSIQDVHGNWFQGNDVFGALVSHYSAFLGTQDQVVKLVNDDLFSNVLDSNVASSMIRQVTREEVKSAIFSIGENKAPGPDGYTSAFFKTLGR